MYMGCEKKWRLGQSNWWGNANTWAINAGAQGCKAGNVPILGAIGVWDGGEYGHVAYVTNVQSDSSSLGSELQSPKQINHIVATFT